MATSSKSSAVCVFCNKVTARYTCPKCNVAYCSANCYRNELHQRCAEDFYKDSVLKHLSNQKYSEQEVKKVQGILKNNYEKFMNEELDSDDDEDDSEEPSLEERLQGLDLDKCDSSAIWECLTADERKDFNTFIESAEAHQLIDEWTPWWKAIMKKPVITEIGSDAKGPKFSQACPHVPSDIPKLTDMLKSEPSPSIKYNLVNILYAYAFLSKYYNGELHENLLEATELFYNICDILGKNINFDCVDMAIYTAIHNIHEIQWVRTSNAFLVDRITDVGSIVKGQYEESFTNYYILAALEDAKKLFNNTYKELKRNKNQEKNKILEYRKIGKKIEFYMSWAVQYELELPSLHKTLKIIYEKAKTDLQKFVIDAVRVCSSQEKKSNKVLIKEL